MLAFALLFILAGCKHGLERTLMDGISQLSDVITDDMPEVADAASVRPVTSCRAMTPFLLILDSPLFLLIR